MDRMTESNTSNDSLRDQVRVSIDQLRALKDEIRLRIHLGGMDARDAWARLEPQFDEAERLARNATVLTGRAIDQLVAKFRELRDSLPHH